MTQTAILLPDELYERLRKDAFERKVSMSQIIRDSLNEAYGTQYQETPSEISAPPKSTTTTGSDTPSKNFRPKGLCKHSSPIGLCKYGCKR